MSIEECPSMPPLDKKDSGVDVVGNMASQGGKKSDSPRRKMLYESRRAREFYRCVAAVAEVTRNREKFLSTDRAVRYYQPIRELTKTGPPTCDIGNDQAVQSHRPLSCPDRALTV